MSSRLDRIDLKMLRLLQNNGRLSNAELAQTVAISPATCHRRTQRLFEDGFIAAVRAMVAPKKVAKGTLVMVGVVLDRSTPESFAIFEQAIAKLKFVLDCHLVAGDFRAARRAPDPHLFRDEGSRRQRAAGVLSGSY